jgi:hypothetical protein
MYVCLIAVPREVTLAGYIVEDTLTGDEISCETVEDLELNKSVVLVGKFLGIKNGLPAVKVSIHDFREFLSPLEEIRLFKLSESVSFQKVLGDPFSKVYESLEGKRQKDEY